MLGSARSVLMKKPGVTLPNTLLASYSFSEGSGTTTADASGHGHTLTLNSATWATGHTGGGISNTTTGQGAGAAFTAPTAAITIMAWIKPLSLVPGNTYLSMGLIDNGGNTDVAIFTQRGDFGTSDILQCNLRIAGTLRSIYGPALTVGTWTHIAVTFNGTTIALYLNGTLYTSSSFSGTLGTGDRIAIAGNDPVNAYDSEATVDDARIFSTALTAAEVSAAMSTPVA